MSRSAFFLFIVGVLISTLLRAGVGNSISKMAGSFAQEKDGRDIVLEFAVGHGIDQNYFSTIIEKILQEFRKRDSFQILLQNDLSKLNPTMSLSDSNAIYELAKMTKSRKVVEGKIHQVEDKIYIVARCRIIDSGKYLDFTRFYPSEQILTDKLVEKIIDDIIDEFNLHARGDKLLSAVKFFGAMVLGGATYRFLFPPQKKEDNNQPQQPTRSLPRPPKFP